MTDQTWAYKGHNITFNPVRASFEALVENRTFRAGSLDAIKKKLDKEVAFVPFPCYLEKTGWDSSHAQGVVLHLSNPHTGARALVEATVVGVEKSAARLSSPQWRVIYKGQRGQDTQSNQTAVTPRTPEALAAWELYWTTREAGHAAMEELKAANSAKLEPLHKAMIQRRAGEEV